MYENLTLNKEDKIAFLEIIHARQNDTQDKAEWKQENIVLFYYICIIFTLSSK